MATITADHAHSTSEVLNQAPPLGPASLLETDLALREALEREHDGWGVDRVRDVGEVAGSAEAAEHAWRAEHNLPRLHTHDRYGHRIDEVECDPSWHWLLRTAIEHEIHSLPWRESRPGAHVVRTALGYLWNQASGGVMCPVCMTHGAVPTLRAGAPELASEWEPRMTESDYARVVLAGQAMTERQGGSDVRANTTRAEPLGDGSYEIWGHKWFCSAPMCDVFLLLAQAPEGLSLFLIERGPGMELQRLKDKLGTRSLPTAEVEFRGVRGWLVGEEGRGVRTVMRQVTHARLDCLMGSSAGLRAGVRQAVHHARHRKAFGALLVEQPAMRNVLADLAIESEAATAAMMRLGRAFDEDDDAFRRLGLAVTKYWVCKRAPSHAAEALECLGGNGYVEDSGMPLLFRESPVSSIWEGPGNVMALDVLRTIAKQPDSLHALLAECALAAGGDARLDAHLARLEQSARALPAEGDPQFVARRLVEDLAVGLQASLLVRHAPHAVADAFSAGRLTDGGRVFGTLPRGIDAEAIIERAWPSAG